MMKTRFTLNAALKETPRTPGKCPFHIRVYMKCILYFFSLNYSEIKEKVEYLEFSPLSVAIGEVAA